MNVTRAFTLRTLKKNRVRTAVTIAGIALATALLTAVLTSVSSLNGFLYDREVADNGSWQMEAVTTNLADVQAAEASDSVGALSTVTELGFAQPDEANARYVGTYLAVKGIDDDFDDLLTCNVKDGRLPQAPNEIVLHASYKGSTAFSDEEIALGSTVNLALGKRQPVGPAEALGDMPAYLNSSHGYLDGTAADDENVSDDGTAADAYKNGGAALTERLVDIAPTQAYTVVGFYHTTNAFTQNSAGTTGLTYLGDAANAPDAATFAAYFTVPGARTVADLEQASEALFGDDATYRPHNALLRYAGITDDRALWDTVFQLALVLAVVIAVASASLIYNSFAISIAERTRQFGLLASIGASRRQIRGMVLTEAGFLALIGVPLGLVVGVAGTGVVLSALSPMLAEVLDADATFGLSVNASYLALAAAMAVVTVLVSAWIPSRRAANVSAIDAVRSTQDVRVTKATARTADLANPWKPRGLQLGARLFGMSGAIAQRNLKRSKGKGRAAVISLTVAVVLLVTAGALDTTMRTAMRASIGETDVDVRVTAISPRNTDGSVTVDDFIATCDGASRVADVQELGTVLQIETPVTIPADMATDALREGETSVVQSDGSVQVQATLALIDDESYRAYLAEQGLDAAQYLDADAPLAIAAPDAYSNNGQTYEVRTLLQSAGTVDAYRYDLSRIEGADPTQGLLSGEYVLQGGERGVAAAAADGSAVYATRDEAAEKATTLHIGALAHDLPPMLYDSEQLRIMLPLSALDTLNGAGLMNSMMLTSAYAADNHAQATAAMQEYLEQSIGDNSAHAYDVAESREQSELLATVLSTFSFSFAAILTLIAVANVFNTLVNSLTLRRREFAVLRSVGMSNKAFNRMVTWECVRYGAVALVAGTALSLAVAYLLHDALTESVSGIAFAVPWTHLGIAFAVVTAATVVSTLYGLHRARSGNVVEALRADVM